MVEHNFYNLLYRIKLVIPWFGVISVAPWVVSFGFISMISSTGRELYSFSVRVIGGLELYARCGSPASADPVLKAQESPRSMPLVGMIVFHEHLLVVLLSWLRLSLEKLFSPTCMLGLDCSQLLFLLCFDCI